MTTILLAVAAPGEAVGLGAELGDGKATCAVAKWALLMSAKTSAANFQNRFLLLAIGLNGQDKADRDRR